MESADPREVTVNLGFPFPSRPQSVGFLTRKDSVTENEECLVMVLSVDEERLDTRDRGAVDFTKRVALFRIQNVDGKWTRVLEHVADTIHSCFVIEFTGC